MRILLIPALLFGLVAASPTRAQQAAPSPEALAAAREMMELLSRDALAQMSSMLMKQALAPLERHPNMTPEKMDALRAEVQRITLRFMNGTSGGAPAIYAKYLTVEEMREIIAFYRTPTGDKIRKLLPQIATEVMALVLPRVPELERELTAAIQPILQKP